MRLEVTIDQLQGNLEYYMDLVQYDGAFLAIMMDGEQIASILPPNLSEDSDDEWIGEPEEEDEDDE